MCTLLLSCSGNKELGVTSTYGTGCYHLLNVSPSSRSKKVQNYQLPVLLCTCYGITIACFPKPASLQQYFFRQYPTKVVGSWAGHNLKSIRLSNANCLRQ